MSSEAIVQTLKKQLSDWTDIDVTQHYLAMQIGFAETDSETHKAIYWSDNVLGNLIAKILDELVELGYLEKRDEPD
ncbi:MAG: hypothetical protein AAF846_04035 [Chloroflexota bacterium]